jgi:hypothetical protein
LGTELLGGIVIVMLVTAALLHVALRYIEARDVIVTERTLRYAAQAQLDRYRAGAPIDSPLPKGILPKKATLMTKTAPGAGPWSGMTKVMVTASLPRLRGRTPSVTLAGYIKEVRR